VLYARPTACAATASPRQPVVQTGPNTVFSRRRWRQNLEQMTTGLPKRRWVAVVSVYAKGSAHRLRVQRTGRQRGAGPVPPQDARAADADWQEVTRLSTRRRRHFRSEEPGQDLEAGHSLVPRPSTWPDPHRPHGRRSGFTSWACSFTCPRTRQDFAPPAGKHRTSIINALWITRRITST